MKRVLIGAALALLTTAEARAQIRPVSWHVRAVPFYTRTAQLGVLPVYPILAPAVGNLGVLAQVFGPGGGNPETLLTGLTDDTVLVDSGAAWVRKAIPNCVDTGGNHLNYTAATNAFSCGTSGAAAGANAALSNLAAVSINASLIPQTTLDLGAQATPFRDMWLYGAGTYGSHSFRFTGTPSGHRVITIRDTDGIMAFRNVDNQFTVNQTMTGNSIQLSLSASAGNAYLMLNGSSFPGITFNKNDTPDTVRLNTGTASNHVILAEGGDDGYDYAVAQQTNPTLVVASASQSPNERIGVRHNQTQPQVVDLANTAASGRPVGLHGGSIVASAATIAPTGNAFHISGTTNINTVTVMASGTVITLIFDGVLTVGDVTGNINLSAGFTTSANDTLTLVSDGASWFELGRSVN